MTAVVLVSFSSNDWGDLGSDVVEDTVDVGKVSGEYGEEVEDDMKTLDAF
jgi:hypothetical protein